VRSQPSKVPDYARPACRKKDENGKACTVSHASIDKQGGNSPQIQRQGLSCNVAPSHPQPEEPVGPSLWCARRARLAAQTCCLGLAKMMSGPACPSRQGRCAATRDGRKSVTRRRRQGLLVRVHADSPRTCRKVRHVPEQWIARGTRASGKRHVALEATVRGELWTGTEEFGQLCVWYPKLFEIPTT